MHCKLAVLHQIYNILFNTKATKNKFSLPARKQCYTFGAGGLQIYIINLFVILFVLLIAQRAAEDFVADVSEDFTGETAEDIMEDVTMDDVEEDVTMDDEEKAVTMDDGEESKSPHHQGLLKHTGKRSIKFKLNI